MCKEEVEDAPNVVISTFSTQAQLVDVLFDFGATHSFISVKLVETLGRVPSHRPPLLYVTLPFVKTVKCDELHEDCPI